MKGLVDSRRYRDALDLVQKQTSILNDKTITLALKASAAVRDYEQGVRIHQQLSKESLNNPWIQSSLMHFYMQCNDIANAEKVFSSIKPKSVYAYGVLFKGYIASGQPEKVIELYKNLSVKPDSVLYILLFNACGKHAETHSIHVGKHALQRLPSIYRDDPKLVNAAINMLMNFRNVMEAERLFESLKNKSLVSYGAMMQGYIDNQMPERALDLFEKIPFALDDVSYTIVFSACASLNNTKAIQFGNRILRSIPTTFKKDSTVLGSILRMLMKFRQIKDAENLCSSSKKKTPVLLGIMMQGYVDNGMPGKALDLFEKSSIPPNEVTMIILYSACAALNDERAVQLGKKLLRLMPVKFRENGVLVGSALNMLMKFGQVKEAEDLFSQVTHPTANLYGIMMHGYNHNEQPDRSMELFEKLKGKDLNLDDHIYLAWINAAAQIGILEISQKVADQLPPECREKTQIQNALIDMWGKSLIVDKATKMFGSISQPNILTYTAMINAYGRCGMGSEAIHLYQTIPEHMRDDISRVCILNACSHSGFINQAQKIYQQIDLKTEQITTTMVDGFSRMYMFDEAQDLIKEYERSNSPSLIMYMTLLSGARNARLSSLAQEVYSRMQTLFPSHRSDLISASILLSNTYISIGNHENARNIQDHRIQHYGRKAKPGITWTTLDDQLWAFSAHDTSHPRSREIYAKLDEILLKIKQHNYEIDPSCVTRPLANHETLEGVLWGHSEKLAIAFNLIQEPQPSVIRLTKNLRICRDCHNASKLIAKVYHCDIIARDANRGHHFDQNGQCSCQDHF